MVVRARWRFDYWRLGCCLVKLSSAIFFMTWPDASQAFASQFDPMGVVNETVEDRIGVGWVVDDLMPAVHGELGCDDGRAAASAPISVKPLAMPWRPRA